MTHVDNIPHIIDNGITSKVSANSNPKYRSIGDNSLIGARDGFIMPNGDLLGSYIPFYFGCRTPMLYVIQNGYNGVPALPPSEIVYCITSVQQIIDSGLEFVYSDGHATDRFTNFYPADDVGEMESQVDFNATKAKFWKDENDLDLKRRKEAEFLIKEDLTFSDIKGFVVYNDSVKGVLMNLGITEGKIVVKPTLYF